MKRISLFLTRYSLILVVVFASVLLLTQNTKAEDGEHMPIVGQKALVSSLFCDKQAQLKRVIVAANKKNDIKAGKKIMKKMRTVNKIPCGFVKLVTVVEEVLSSLMFLGRDGVVVKGKIVGVEQYDFLGRAYTHYFPSNTPTIIQYFWAKTGSKKKIKGIKI